MIRMPGTIPLAHSPSLQENMFFVESSREARFSCPFERHWIGGVENIGNITDSADG